MKQMASVCLYALLALAVTLTAAAFIPDTLARLRAARKAELLARGARFYRVQVPNDSTRYRLRREIVRGNSMSLVIPSGEEELMLEDYYRLNAVRRLEVIAIKPSELPIVLVKAVYGLPGDRWGLEDGAGRCWRIIINGAAIGNSEGEEYCVLKHRSVALAKAARLHPVIPSGRYLVLGTMREGTFDSTQLGLIGRDWIAARVVRPSAGSDL